MNQRPFDQEGTNRCVSCGKFTHGNEVCAHPVDVKSKEYYALHVIACAVRSLLTNDEIGDLPDDEWRTVITFALSNAMFELNDAVEV